jgi:hypothetical protein
MDRRGLRKEFIDKEEVIAVFEGKPIKLPKTNKNAKRGGFLFFKKKT